MKFSEDSTEGHYHIQSYGEGWIQVNQRRMERGFIIHTDRIVDDWDPLRYADLQAEHLAKVFGIQAELILIGTGKHHRLPTPEIHKALIQQQTGFELMTTDAACRTYNVLLSEFRDVVAVLFPE